MEFLAVILGLLLAWRSNIRHFHYQLHGDSISSLAWAKADRVNSTLARRANIDLNPSQRNSSRHCTRTWHIERHLRWVITRLVTIRPRLRPNIVLQYCNRRWDTYTNYAMRPIT